MMQLSQQKMGFQPPMLLCGGEADVQQGWRIGSTTGVVVLARGKQSQQQQWRLASVQFPLCRI